MHIRRGKSDIFGVRILPKVIFLGPNKSEIMFMRFLLTSNFVELIFLGSLEAILTSVCIVSKHFTLGCLKISWTDQRPNIFPRCR